MSTWTETNERYDIQLKSPMGWIKIYAELTIALEAAFFGRGAAQ